MKGFSFLLDTFFGRPCFLQLISAALQFNQLQAVGSGADTKAMGATTVALAANEKAVDTRLAANASIFSIKARLDALEDNSNGAALVQTSSTSDSGFLWMLVGLGS